MVQSIPGVALSTKRGEAYTPTHNERRESFKVDKDMVNFKHYQMTEPSWFLRL